MGDDWWPSPPASPDKATPSLKEPALPSNRWMEAQFPMDVQNERREKTLEPTPKAQDGPTEESVVNQDSE